MNAGEWAGLLIFLAGGALYLFDRYLAGKSPTLQEAGRLGLLAPSALWAKVRGEAAPARELTTEEKLTSVVPGQFVQWLGMRYQCTGTVVLHQLLSNDNGDTWEPTGNTFHIVQLGTRALVHIPTSDDGHPVWFKMEIGELANLLQFIAGTPNHPGPAMRFADSNMQAVVNFGWRGREWRVVTLGECAFDANTAPTGGRCFLSGHGQLRYMLAKETNGSAFDYWLAIDKEDGHGEDVLFVGPQVNIEAAIEDVL